MTKRHLPRPTDGELEILTILWERGPCTVRDVHEELSRSRPTRYTTALKLMQIMTEKGLLCRDETQRAHIYKPSIARQKTLRQLTRDLLDRAFAGSSERLVMHALRAKKVSAKELAKIRDMLDELGRDKK